MSLAFNAVAPDQRQGLKRRRSGYRFRHWETEEEMELILWLIAVVLVIAGIIGLIRGQLLWGIALIVIGLLVGPGGVSLFA